ncbi:MAG: response regulator [Lachnospiraceae bacterium]|nr:response regulator [Ruminococcus sp.]MCM1274728.1 response regulator [Lachnospiraceae bacterium]
MYHCNVRFYFIGSRREVFDVIRAFEPPEKFEYDFYESEAPEPERIKTADVIVTDIADFDVFVNVKKNVEFILLVNGGAELYAGLPDYVDDVWELPMSPEEIKFRFARCQRKYVYEVECWQTRQFLNATIDNIPSLVWFKTKDGVHTKVNKSFCETVGKTKQQVEGQRHAYIWDVEEDDPACIESERIVMETGKTAVSEERVKSGDEYKLLETYKSPLYNVDGSVMGTVGVAIDITKERAYEEDLVKKNAALEKVFTSIDCGVLCHSLDGKRIISANDAALKILGYKSVDELLSDGFNMVAMSVLDEDKPMLRERIKTLKNENDSISVEYGVKHENGDILHIMGNVKMLKANGELFYQRFLLDVTEQKERERENERHQAELIQALGSDYNLICFFDVESGEGQTLRTHDCEHHVLSRIFSGDLDLKFSMEKYIGECVYSEDRELLRSSLSKEMLVKELSVKETFHVNYRTMCNGSLRYFQMKAVRAGEWSDEKGAVLGFRSVDDEIRAEMEKKELLESALMQANRANKAKSVFLSNMSHDIRTPMNAIVGFTSLAISHIDQKERVEEYLKKISTSGSHLLSLINDVLDMSRIESGKMHLEEKPCSLPEILHGLRSILQADINAKQLELSIDTINVYNENIVCDKLRLNQVLLNLLSNAVKYTGAGGKITVRIAEIAGAPEGSANYEFTIKDTGIGMSPEFVEHIFEPFERERNSTISGIQGTGLGMAITKNIVDMMNGTIEVTSEQNVGTECRVSFMFKLNEEAKQPEVIAEFKDQRALVIDDDFNTCDSVSYMLQQLGLRAEWTLSGKEAVLRTRHACSRGDNYGVYIVDCFLPDMNGIEVVRRIRKETDDNVPVIVLTAYDWSEFEEEARAAGVSAFCSKPLFLSELRKCLGEIVSAKASEEENLPEKTRSGRILLAEDNELNQEIAVEILSEGGFDVEVAENGSVAVDMLSRSKPGYYKLILMDVQMPVMNGYDATRKIRALENKALADIPILAMTANAFEEDKQQALDCGMNGHVAKPINIKQLFETLDMMLNK